MIGRSIGSITRLLLAAVCVVLVWWPSSAAARKPGCYPERDGVHRSARPRWPASSRLRVVDELIELRCEQGASEEKLVCQWHGVHVYERDDPSSPAPATAITFDPPGRLEDVEVRIDGRRLELDEGAGQKITIHDAGVAPRVVLEVITVVWRYEPVCVSSSRPYQRRHILVSQRPLQFIWTSVDPTSHSRWGRGDMSEELTVVVEAPARVKLEPQGHRPYRYVHQYPRRAAGEVRARYDVDTRVEMRVVGASKIPGGVFLGVGGALLDVEHGLRGRFGAEFAAPDQGRNLLFHSLAVETDFRDSFTIVPAIELMRSNFLLSRLRVAYWIVPSFGIGTGVPLQIQPREDLRPGLRALASASWPLIGFVATFDWYPKYAPTQQGRMQLGLLAELRF